MDAKAKIAYEIALKNSPALWFRAFGAIQAKGGMIVKPPHLQPNYLQHAISDVVSYCYYNNIPARLIILKPRQKGCSTFSTACLYRHLSTRPSRGAIVGGFHEQGQNLMKMLRTYVEHDDSIAEKPEILQQRGTWPNSSTVVQLTAKNKEVGRGGTFEVLLCTEVARWSEDGVANAADVLAGLLKCVPDQPNTLVIFESTAAGASGDFYERWQSAITFEDLKAGKRGFVKIFAPWFRFDDSTRAPHLEGIQSQSDFSQTETQLAIQHSLTLEQIAWMRWAIREECKGDFDAFCQDYPSDDITAFLTSGRRRFSAHGLAYMQQKFATITPIAGNIEENNGRCTFRPTTDGEARVLVWEKPQTDCRYLVAVDPATGASQTTGSDPDNHAVVVWRAGYYTPTGYRPPSVVAHLIGDYVEYLRNRKYVLQYDIDILEEYVWRLSQYYGNCLIVPEINMDRGLVELLKKRPNVNLFHRELANSREGRFGSAPGFLTNYSTRERIIEHLAHAIREYDTDERVEIPSPIIRDELSHFIIGRDGKSQAASGKHDDLVMATAIGYMCIGAATPYKQERLKEFIPPDLRPFVISKTRRNAQFS
jgi:hypothetical protein